jgi:putative membrane protein
VGFVVALHLFGVIFWLGSLLMITRWLAMVPDEVGIAKERFIVASERLFKVGGNIGAATALATGILLVLLDPRVLTHGWMILKLLLVGILLLYHARLYRRIVTLADEPASASRKEFMTMHGVVSLVLLAILLLVALRPL